LPESVNGAMEIKFIVVFNLAERRLRLQNSCQDACGKRHFQTILDAGV
jgi:hypothetical protein